VLHRDAQRTQARKWLADGHASRAQAFSLLGRHAEANSDWDRAVECADEPMRSWYRMERTLVRARLGDHIAATQRGNDLIEDLGLQNRRYLVSAASTYALSSRVVLQDESRTAPERAELSERYAATAVELLRKAAQRGYKDVMHLKQNQDLDP